MFDMKTVAENLRNLRMQKGITQLELADLMGVSYQAVSNWERGNSMPDISKLPELAEIFSCQIDDLLGHSPEAEFIQKVEAGEPVVPKTEVLKETAVLLKPDQVADYSQKIAKENKLSLSDVIILAPFLDRENLKKLLSCLDLSSEQIEFSNLVSLAPFIGREALGQLTKQYLEQNPKEDLDLNKLVELAPFLQRDLLSELFSKVDLSEQKITFWNLQCFAPFITRELFGNLTAEFLKQGNTLSISELSTIAPFLSREQTENCLSAYFLSGRMDRITMNDITVLAPFVGKDALGKLLERLLENQ